MNQGKSNIAYIFIGGAILGGILFILIYGVKILDFTYVDWIYSNTGSDFFQHQIGFEFFKNDNWRFPVGVYKNYAYPQGTSIVYTDSIPIFAIFFKLVKKLMPSTFQYFGLWGISCFSLTGGLSAIIINKYIKNYFLIMIIIPFFVCSTGILWRLYAHSSLAGHWIILLALAVYIYRDKFSSLKLLISIWAAITSLSVLIHSYFLVIVGIIMVGYLIDDYLRKKKLLRVFSVFTVSVICTLVTFFIVGGFIPGGSVSEEGLGSYSMNLNGMINPQGYSTFLKDLPLADTKQYEGFQYLGLGLIILSLICIIVKIENFKKPHFLSKKGYYLQKYTGYLFIILSLTLLALSPKITLSSIYIIDYSNGLLDKVLSPFRSTGRFFWPVWYLVALYVIITLYRYFKMKTFMILTLFCLFVQINDLKPLINLRSLPLKESNIEYITPLQSSFWDNASNYYKHINLLSNGLIKYEPLAIYAAHHELTLNNGYIARRDFSLISQNISNDLKNLAMGNLQEEDLYIIPEEEPYNKYFSTNENLLKLYINGYYVYVKNNNNLKQCSKYLANDYDPILIPKDVMEKTQLIGPPIDVANQSILFKNITANWDNESKIIMISGELINVSTVDFYSYAIFTNPMALSFHISKSDGTNVLYDNTRYYFDSIIAPNDTRNFEIEIDLSSFPSGKYKIDLDCVQEGVGWFFDQPENQNRNKNARTIEVIVD